jgi:hypothetical protein
MNNNMEKAPDINLSESIAEALLKLKKEPQKEGVDLLDITKKLSSKKFDKKK